MTPPAQICGKHVRSPYATWPMSWSTTYSGAAIQESKFNQTNCRCAIVKAKSCTAALGHLAQAFMAADCPDPWLARDGKTTLLLQR